MRLLGNWNINHLNTHKVWLTTALPCVQWTPTRHSLHDRGLHERAAPRRQENPSGRSRWFLHPPLIQGRWVQEPHCRCRVQPKWKSIKLSKSSRRSTLIIGVYPWLWTLDAPWVGIRVSLQKRSSRGISLRAHTTLRSFPCWLWDIEHFYKSGYRLLHSYCSPFGLAEYHRVIGITHKGKPSAFEFFVQFVEHDVTQQRT